MLRSATSLRRVLSRAATAAVAIVLLGLSAAPQAQAWWEGKWSQRMQVQLDASAKAADIKENLTDIPVLVRLHTGNFAFASAKEDGSDIRFVGSDDKTPLKHHIEKFDPAEEIALIWVKAPGLASGSAQNALWMYYGNNSAPDGQDARGTYDVNQVAVYHFSETDGAPKDATAYANHAASASGKAGVPAVAGSGYQLSGADALLKISRSPSLVFEKGFTFSAWVKPAQSAAKAALFSWDDGSRSIRIDIDNGMVSGSVLSAKGSAATPKNASLSSGRWQHVALTVEPDKRITLFVNGVEAASAPFKGAVPAPTADLIIGNAAKGGSPFIGDLDEVQLSNVARTAGWTRAAFQGQAQEGALTSLLAAEEGGGGGESLTIHLAKVIIRTITLDGWLVIGLLVLMGFWALYIARQKVVLLNAAGKGNESFRQSFHSLDHPLTLVTREDEFAGSSLFRVYSAGCEELKNGIEKRGEAFTGGKVPSERTMNGFKAAVEKAAMYESRRLGAGMFIMTLCVAGGPFLGLLGTVWGVMNTFAGLAESGEANLAAIAPGVASALACTMAGLMVAIPALFVSNYLTGRIKDMNADVNVFIDDFILKLEEGY